MSMNILAQERNYLPIDIETKYQCCLRRKKSKRSIRKILSYYHVKRSSLFRWLKLFDGTKESLFEKSHRPKTDHPKKLCSKITKRILNLHRRNPDYSFIEIWVNLKHEGKQISAISVLRTLKKAHEYGKYVPAKKKHNKVYHTPTIVHEKRQVDVKYVPRECKIEGLEGRFYQYTILDECSRKRALYFTNEHSMYETVNALKYAKKYFGCLPKEIQTDNGFEFSDKVRRNKDGKNSREYDNYLEVFLTENNIKHHLIRPRTPEHNGKVERSHRIDQDKFYRTLKFYSLKDLKKQGKAWNKRYNDLPKMVLNFKSPNEIELEKLKKLFKDTGEIRCLKRLTSIVS